METYGNPLTDQEYLEMKIKALDDFKIQETDRILKEFSRMKRETHCRITLEKDKSKKAAADLVCEKKIFSKAKEDLLKKSSQERLFAYDKARSNFLMNIFFNHEYSK